jgi:hypothetical protein
VNFENIADKQNLFDYLPDPALRTRFVMASGAYSKSYEQVINKIITINSALRILSKIF